MKVNKNLSFLIILLSSLSSFCYGMDSQIGLVEIYNGTDQGIMVKLTASMSGDLAMDISPINPNSFIADKLRYPIASTYNLEILNKVGQMLSSFQINIGIEGNLFIDVKKADGKIKIIPYGQSSGIFKSKPKVSRGNHSLINNVNIENIKQK